MVKRMGKQKVEKRAQQMEFEMVFGMELQMVHWLDYPMVAPMEIHSVSNSDGKMVR